MISLRFNVTSSQFYVHLIINWRLNKWCGMKLEVRFERTASQRFNSHEYSAWEIFGFFVFTLKCGRAFWHSRVISHGYGWNTLSAVSFARQALSLDFGCAAHTSPHLYDADRHNFLCVVWFGLIASSSQPSVIMIGTERFSIPRRSTYYF